MFNFSILFAGSIFVVIRVVGSSRRDHPETSHSSSSSTKSTMAPTFPASSEQRGATFTFIAMNRLINILLTFALVIKGDSAKLSDTLHHILS